MYKLIKKDDVTKTELFNGFINFNPKEQHYVARLPTCFFFGFF